MSVLIIAKLSDGKLRWSKAIHIHPSYDVNAYEHDTVIVKIEAPVEFNGSIKRVCLPNEGSFLIVTWFINCFFILLQQVDFKIRSIKNSELCAPKNAFVYSTSWAFDRKLKYLFCILIGQDFNDTTGIAAGWGWTKDDKSNKDLHKVDLPIMTVDEWCTVIIFSRKIK